jgi:hypothetical protein
LWNSSRNIAELSTDLLSVREGGPEPGAIRGSAMEEESALWRSHGVHVFKAEVTKTPLDIKVREMV